MRWGRWWGIATLVAFLGCADEGGRDDGATSFVPTPTQGDDAGDADGADDGDDDDGAASSGGDDGPGSTGPLPGTSDDGGPIDGSDDAGSSDDGGPMLDPPAGGSSGRSGGGAASGEVRTTASGVQYRVIAPGDAGPLPAMIVYSGTEGGVTMTNNLL